MVEKVTLQLPEKVIERAHVAANRTGRAIEQVLTEWVARGAERDVESLIVPDAEYPIYTPFGNEAAVQVLLDTFRAHQTKKDEQK